MEAPVARILIVDDERVLLATLQAALSGGPWDVAVATSAEEGLALFEPDAWDMLIIDKNLPGISGVELIRRVRKVDTRVGILMITGYGSAESALETLHLGVDGYLEKPFDDIFVITRRVEAVLVKKRARLDSGADGAIGHFKKATERLKALSERRAGPASLVVAIVTGDDARADWLTGRLEPSDSIARARTLPEAARAAATGPADVVIFDLALCDGDVLVPVEELRRAAPDATLVVIASTPPLEVVTRLIELDVRAVLETPLSKSAYETHVGGLLARIRLGLSAGTGPFAESNDG